MQINRPRVVVFAAVVGCVAVASVASGQTSGPEPFPSLAFVWSDDSPSRMQIKCAPASPRRSGRSRITCDFLQDMIGMPPARAEIDREVASEEASMRAAFAKNPGAVWKDCGKVAAAMADAGAASIGDEDEAFRAQLKALSDACQHKDIQPLIDAAAAEIRQKGQTCTLRTPNEFTESLERTDADTWIGNAGPRGLCNVTVTVTLRRTVSSGYALWSFKQVRVTPDGQSGLTCVAGVSTTSMPWNGRHDWKAACQYLKL